MRQDIDLASLGSIRTLEFIENSPPPNNPFDYALPPVPQVHTSPATRTKPFDTTYWQMGGPTLA